MSRFQTYIFDFDGTLADTLPLCFESLRMANYASLGQVMSDDEICAYFGPSEEVIIRGIVSDRNGKAPGSVTFPQWELPDKDLLSDYAINFFYWAYGELFDRYISDSSSVIVKDVLQQLRARGGKVALVTGKGRRSTAITLDRMGIADLFDVVVTDDDVARPKPSPDGLLLVLDSLSASREGAVFVGDMDADVEAARRARVTSVGAAWYKPSISSGRPDLWARELGELLSL